MKSGKPLGGNAVGNRPKSIVYQSGHPDDTFLQNRKMDEKPKTNYGRTPDTPRRRTKL
jgi:hypothetical protein